jgi:hypothetical protein
MQKWLRGSQFVAASFNDNGANASHQPKEFNWAAIQLDKKGRRLCFDHHLPQVICRLDGPLPNLLGSKITWGTIGSRQLTLATTGHLQSLCMIPEKPTSSMQLRGRISSAV